MRRFSILSAVVFVLGLFVQSAGPAIAQGYGEGLLNAIAYKPLPQGSAFSVQPLDNSDQNMRLKKEFEQILTRQGFSVSADAQLIITFETRDELGAYKTRDRRAILELDAHGGREGGEDARMRFNLYDSNSGGIFNQGKGETSVMTPSQYRLEVSIDNRTNGKRHWQAWSVANLGQSDGASLIRAMIPEMVGNMGKTITSRTFELF
ncbi:MAG: hypothetical protein HOL66_16000 [Rhodospirillaceae bacterium]|jgi:hypothetical protein|nr:hypothetical protein [Rhodospirillaceae bacterium]MBT5245737.1 hypothetical protein [Rhodospirillaceae bacterium]MBT5561473.1 hypothetical protein [Rhodospirillaceae bacterium]MBT6242927.1 hypothetical protein [Rhodospirillaceae bacterium]MBT7138247.1 hypothetical protein [Rhodospirillaceae bacterium]